MIKSLLTFLTLVTSVLVFSQGHNIKITIEGIPEESAIIGFHLGNKQHLLDTVIFDENKSLVIKGEEQLLPGMYFVYTPSLYLEFLIKEQNFELATTLDGGYRDLKTVGSPENELFRAFQLGMASLQRDQRKLVDSLNQLTGEDSITVRKEIGRLGVRSGQFMDSLTMADPNAFFTKMIHIRRGPEIPDFSEIEDENERQRKQFEHYKEHYFDPIGDPTDLLRTPLLHGFTMKYFEEMVLPIPDSLNIEIDRWLSKVKESPDSFRYWLVTFFQKYQESKIMGHDAVWVHLAENYYLTGEADWISEESIKTIEKEIRFTKPNLIGRSAPDFNTIDTTLNAFRVADIKSKYLILFFYDPDCGHCRKKTPVLRDAYKDIKALGGEVLGICTTSDIDKWKKFVKEYNLEWPNVGDPYGKSNFRVDYNVRTTPQVYILDSDRKIIGKRLDVGDQLMDFL